jgi:hypothetical protein
MRFVVVVLKDLCIRPDRITASKAGFAVVDFDKTEVGEFDADVKSNKFSFYQEQKREKGVLIDRKI